jgi:hypothetical protein
MEHRGVRYTIRIGIEPRAWSVAIHPGGVESAMRLIHGTRHEAESLARSMIERWLKERRATRNAERIQTDG